MIAAIVVTYNPEQSGLTKLLQSSLPQVDCLIIVDNGSVAPVKQWIDQTASDKIHWIALGKNCGIAAAHNAGIVEARRLKADYVLIFDHDSAPLPDMVEKLGAALRQKQAEGYRIAAVGPCYNDHRRATPTPPPFLQIKGLRLMRHSRGMEPVVPVDYLVSSGSLIPMSTLDAVGGMEEALFIDYVDIEWGLRAKNKGYASFGSFDAQMEHALGDETANFFGHKVAMHGPLRHYYAFRNAVWMYRQKTVPLNWKIVDGSRFLVRFVFYALCGKPHGAHVRNMVQGIWDGLCGNMGKKNA